MAPSHPLTARPGLGLVFALLLLLCAEAALHTDAFLYRYRSVFAAGRAMDKIRFIESNAPSVLIVGDSRVDNAFDPGVIARQWGFENRGRIFNFGVPGSDVRMLYGVLTRLDREQLLGPSRISAVVIGLDEGYLQPADTLGYEIFADRMTMIEKGEYRDLLRSLLRLWGFADNLKELREPAKLERFIAASRGNVEPLGGGAAEFAGYRAGFGGLQDTSQIMLQEAGSKNPPDPVRVDYLDRCLELLRKRDVRVAVVFPPLLNREVLFVSPGDPASKPYLSVAAGLRGQAVPLIDLGAGATRDPAEFVNAGHLNDRGANRFSALLADQLAMVWPDLPRALGP